VTVKKKFENRSKFGEYMDKRLRLILGGTLFRKSLLQVDSVLIEAGSPVQAGGRSNCSN